MPLIIAGLGATLLVLVTAITLLGLHQASQVWLRPLLTAIANPHGSFLKRLALAPLAVLGGLVSLVERAVRTTISHYTAVHLPILDRWLSGHALFWRHWFNEQTGVAVDTADGFERMRHKHIPAAITAGVVPAARPGTKQHADAVTGALNTRKTLRELQKGIDALDNELNHKPIAGHRGIDRLLKERVLPGLRDAETELDAIQTKDLPRLRSRVKAREDDWEGVRGKPAAIEEWLKKAAITAVVVAALGRWGFNFLKCDAWRGLGRKLNCFHGQFLADLLALAFDAILISDLCLMVDLMTSAARLAAPAIDELASQIDGLIQCQGASRAPDFPLKAARLPDVPNPIAL